MFTKYKLKQTRDFIEAQSEESKIYIGCDSESYRKNNKRYADYYLVVVIHIDQLHGCKIFGEKMKAIELCVNRFDTDTKMAFLDLYSKVDAKVESPSNVSVTAGDQSVMPISNTI